MRRTALLALLLAGCAAGPVTTPAATPVPPTVAPVTPTPVPPTLAPTAAAVETPGPNSTFTADDEAIAELIRAASAEAIPQLKLLKDMDVGQLTDLFLDLRSWINAQKVNLAALTPGVCTAGAIGLFIKGMDRYDDIAEDFLAWREWGAVGNPYPLGAPAQAVASLEDALLELEVCPS